MTNYTIPIRDLHQVLGDFQGKKLLRMYMLLKVFSPAF